MVIALAVLIPVTLALAVMLVVGHRRTIRREREFAQMQQNPTQHLKPGKRFAAPSPTGATYNFDFKNISGSPYRNITHGYQGAQSFSIWNDKTP